MQWLMDDDLIDEDKISIMMKAFFKYPKVTLVTSVRRVIDGTGNVIGKEVDKICEISLLVENNVIAKPMLLDARNYIGEPTTTLFRKSDLKHNYYDAASRGYTTISDVAMWLELLEKGDLYYIAEPLSSFRRHEGQEQENMSSIINARNEWLKLICEYYQRGLFIAQNDDIIVSRMGLWFNTYKEEMAKNKNLKEEGVTQKILSDYKNNASVVKKYIAGNISTEQFSQYILQMN
jgi:hypothetical protein